jgi:hypothetical protein
MLHSWAAWAVPVAGVVINQRAYRAARLSASMPILNIVDVIVALVCIAIGLRRLSGSPALDPEPPATSRTEAGRPEGDVVDSRDRS